MFLAKHLGPRWQRRPKPSTAPITSPVLPMEKSSDRWRGSGVPRSMPALYAKWINFPPTSGCLFSGRDEHIEHQWPSCTWYPSKTQLRAEDLEDQKLLLPTASIPGLAVSTELTSSMGNLPRVRQTTKGSFLSVYMSVLKLYNIYTHTHTHRNKEEKMNTNVSTIPMKQYQHLCVSAWT